MVTETFFLVAEQAGGLHKENLKAQKAEKLKATPLLFADYNSNSEGLVLCRGSPNQQGSVA